MIKPVVKKTRDSRKLSVYLFFIILFIVGFVTGSGICYDLYNKKLLSVVNDITDTIENLNVTRSFGLLLKSFFTHFIYIFLIWFLSLTIIGIILVVFIVFFIGFMYGLVISSFMYPLGLNGFLLGFIYTFPQNVMIIPLVIYFSANSYMLAISIFKNFYYNSSRKNLKELMNHYFNQLFFAVIVLILYALIVTIFGGFFVQISKSLI